MDQAPSLTRSLRLATAAWLIGLGAAWVATRFVPAIGLDQYYACELAKQYVTGWPAAFGNHWPLGYPLLGGLLGRLGLQPYLALCSISAVSVLVLLFLTARLLAGSRFAFLIVLAIALIPELSFHGAHVLSEIPFSAAWLGLAVALSGSRGPRSFALACLCAVTAFALRYVGIIALGVLWFWVAWEFQTLRRENRAVAVIGWALATSLLAAGLLYWNFVATGFLSGADRGSTASRLIVWRNLVTSAADLGWSVPAAFMAARLRLLCGGENAVATAIGLLIWGGGLGIIVSAWLRPTQTWGRSVALVGGSYWIGLVLLRAVGDFDPLYNARTFTPEGACFALLIFDGLGNLRLSGGRTLLVIVIAVECAITARGESRGFAGEVRPAVALIRERIRPTDRIQINDNAYAVSAYFSQPVDRAWVEYWGQVPHQRFMVVAGAPQDRTGRPAAISADWDELTRQLITQRTYRVLLDEPGLEVLERISPP